MRHFLKKKKMKLALELYVEKFMGLFLQNNCVLGELKDSKRAFS